MLIYGTPLPVYFLHISNMFLSHFSYVYCMFLVCFYFILQENALLFTQPDPHD